MNKYTPFAINCKDYTKIGMTICINEAKIYKLNKKKETEKSEIRNLIKYIQTKKKCYDVIGCSSGREIILLARTKMAYTRRNVSNPVLKKICHEDTTKMP